MTTNNRNNRYNQNNKYYQNNNQYRYFNYNKYYNNGTRNNMNNQSYSGNYGMNNYRTSPNLNTQYYRYQNQAPRQNQTNQIPRHHMIQEGLDLQALTGAKKHRRGFLNNGSPLARFLNNFTHRGEYLDTKSALYKKYNSQNFTHSTIDHLMYKGLTHDNKATHYADHGRHYLILANDDYLTSGYADMIRVGGTSLSDLPTSLILGRMSSFINFFHAFRSEMNFISLPLPNDSRTQRHAWDKQLNKIRLELINPKLSKHKRAQLLSMQKIVNENLNKLKRIDTNLINQGFVMMIFQLGAPGFSTIHKLDVAVRTAFHFGSDVLNLEPMDARQKEIFLFHLNNPNNERTN